MQRIKLEPAAYLLIAGVLALQIYESFVRGRGVDDAGNDSILVDKLRPEGVYSSSIATAYA